MVSLSSSFASMRYHPACSLAEILEHEEYRKSTVRAYSREGVCKWRLGDSPRFTPPSNRASVISPPPFGC